MMSRSSIQPCLIAMMLVLPCHGFASSVRAADVRAAISARETFVGLPVTLQIQIRDAVDYELPDIPRVDGLSIQSIGAPARSSQVTIINGRRSESSTTTFTFKIVASREGTFSIPPFTVVVDGQQHTTPTMQLAVTKSETGDLMFVEIEGKQDRVYVGEPLELTLRIWIRPYHDKEHRITLSEAEMWKMISDQSSWGPFADRLEELARENQRPGGNEVLREDRSGQQRSYYLFEITTTIYPQRPGRIDGDDVQIVVHYPTAIGKSRDPFSQIFDDDDFSLPRSRFFDDFFSSPFGSRLSVTAVRPIVAETSVSPVEVLPIPTAGRPADYRGAVGRYQVATEAEPRQVKAGDPITLRIGIAGTGPMNLVQAPPLADLPELTADFKVPQEALAGYVNGSRKVFATTIRPLRADVTQIPAIPFSFFDPDSQRFVTVRSDPIPIEVAMADTLELDAIVSRARDPADDDADVLGDASMITPSFNNFDGDDLLVHQTPAADFGGRWFLFASPPMIVCAVLILRHRESMRRRLARWFCSPIQELRNKLQRAEDSAAIARALETFLSRSLRLNAADRAASIGQLRTRGYRDLAIGFERLFDRCDSSNFRADAGVSDRTRLSKDAMLQAQDLQQRLRRKTAATKGKGRPTSSGTSRRERPSNVASLFLLTVLTASLSELRAQEQPTVTLDNAQRKVLLREALELCRQAQEINDDDGAERQRLAGEAAKKYELIVQSGIRNDRLYFNLANSLLQAGQVGRSIANYYRALQFDPTNQLYLTNLSYAQQMVQQPASGGVNPDSTLLSRIRQANQMVNSYVHPDWMFDLAFLIWVAIWVIVGCRLLIGRFAWMSFVAVGFVALLATGGSYLLSTRTFGVGKLGIVTEPNADLREGDGEYFARVADVHTSEGQHVEVVGRRGAWVKVRTPSGRVGWLPSKAVEVVAEAVPGDG